MKTLNSFMLAVIVVVAQVGSAVANPQEPELQLYGVTLRSASVDEFVAAALKAGAVASARAPENASTLDFDASAIAMPGLTRFTLLRQGRDIVSVQFPVAAMPQAEKSLRQMLVVKYGPPQGTEGRPDLQAFADSGFSQVKAQWSFAGGMKLIYNHPFMGPTYLTYVNEPRFLALMAAAKAREGSLARHRASDLGDKF